jgi:hypothetical protein
VQETVTPPCLRMPRLYSLLLVPAPGALRRYIIFVNGLCLRRDLRRRGT